MKLGHYGVARFIQIFRKNDPAHRKLVGEVNMQMAEIALELGFIPYKPPIGHGINSQADRPTYRATMEKLKDARPQRHNESGKLKL